MARFIPVRPIYETEMYLRALAKDALTQSKKCMRQFEKSSDNEDLENAHWYKGRHHGLMRAATSLKVARETLAVER